MIKVSGNTDTILKSEIQVKLSKLDLTPISKEVLSGLELWVNNLKMRVRRITLTKSRKESIIIKSGL
ncbi:MAG: hypothetical protein ACD_4C00167G0001 [uncultured bacterium (gcode 4)]|uniref:Uncharacterized protein n=1 Tax=uncultured bacterium (gcode 4) TaxID=1234023 RepID=K2G9B2_9BACT|nr:MAG: hypothetical protein ACD_4C00167G0001 [uncultured bacterium (gcode 4)]